ncbi:MAG: hypothetical protein IJF92_00805 [Bacilli bacterium]|nr:hypothetical protein [Bacilli bacterium]MBQ3423494.1 hypothetical protein [Romboutsia sp.]
MQEVNRSLKIVFCKNCDEPEYWGCMFWRNGKQYCRKCIYKIWDEENPNANYDHIVFPDL